MEVDRAKLVGDLAKELRAVGVPDPEMFAARIGDRYVALLEVKARELWLGTSPTTPLGFLRVGINPIVENDWVRRRFLESAPRWTDEMLADAGLPAGPD